METFKKSAIGWAKIRRQHPFGSYVADFYCHEKKIVIELDGAGHKEQINKMHDSLRTEIFKTDGIKLIRFWNSEVINDLSIVLEKIRRVSKG